MPGPREAAYGEGVPATGADGATCADGPTCAGGTTAGLADPASGEAEPDGGAVGFCVGLGVACAVPAGLGVETGDGAEVGVTAGAGAGWCVEDVPPMKEPTDVPPDEPPPTREDTGLRVATSMAVIVPIASAKTRAATPVMGFQRRCSTDSERASESCERGRGSAEGPGGTG